MKVRNRVIVILLAIAVILFGVVQFGIIPHNEAEKEKYNLEQLDPRTHDFSNIVKYKSDYMGDSSNIINLFYNLPLSDLGLRFELFPDTLTLEVDYQSEGKSKGEEIIRSALLYNAMAAFTLIGNLEQINFVFLDESYQAKRSEFRKEFGSFADVINPDQWNQGVQDKLKDKVYTQQAADKLLANFEK
ncbi:DUF4825 domain-containing protein [Dehalobacter sp. DCM]|uniref:DUF4825 domain-containing protein n=1 Tax=Dehalobacter sp. DCM TaxID=2907827 RepID=UPI003081DBEC|nr:DUF4825 domain-containing protein [Dehalobacter sp. DCM]